MTIKNLNIPEGNNDMLDRIENIFDNPIFGDEIRKEVIKEIQKLKNTLDDKLINWTQSEQEELFGLLENVLLNEQVDIINKVKTLIVIIEQKIQNEIKETHAQRIQKPKDIINGIINNNIITDVGDITDVFLGISDYVLIIIPSIHQKMLGVSEFNYLNSNPYQKLFIQEYNVNVIFSELIKKGYSQVYSFEGFTFSELSIGFENGISNDLIKQYNEYMEISDEFDDVNSEKILKLQKQILTNGIVNFLPEIKYKDELLSYGIEKFESSFIYFDLIEFINIFIENNIGVDNAGNFVDSYIKGKEELYYSYFGNTKIIKEYIRLLRKELDEESIKKIGIKKYINNLFKKYVYYLHNKRNEDSVENLEQLRENTKANGIILRFGSAHFGYPNNELEELIRKGIIKEEDIKNIKQILKEKGISYIEILPKKED